MPTLFDNKSYLLKIYEGKWKIHKLIVRKESETDEISEFEVEKAVEQLNVHREPRLDCVTPKLCKSNKNWDFSSFCKLSIKVGNQMF